MPSVKIDDVDYDLDDMSEDAKQQILHIEACKNEINRLATLTAICQTAQTGYMRKLKQLLEAQDPDDLDESLGDTLTFD